MLVLVNIDQLGLKNNQIQNFSLKKTNNYIRCAEFLMNLYC